MNAAYKKFPLVSAMYRNFLFATCCFVRFLGKSGVPMGAKSVATLTRLTQTLIRLSEASGVAGFEADIRREVKSLLPESVETSTDKIGNLYATQQGTSERPHVLLEAHMDEIGFLITRVMPSGFLAFRPIGSWWNQVLLSQRVVIQGNRGDVPGVIGSKPPHVLKTDSAAPVALTDMFFDIGARSAQDVENLGVRVGHPAVPDTRCTLTADGHSIIGKAWDNRAGLALLLESFRDLTETGAHPSTITFAATVQEELGSRGLRAMTQQMQHTPDVAFIFEGILSGDLPDLGSDKVPGSVCGGGANIVIHDSSMLANPKLIDWIIDVAKTAGISFQLTPAFGSNNAGHIHLLNGGIPTVVIGIPCRYIHSHNGVVFIEDFIEAKNLMVTLLRQLDTATARSFSA